MTSAEAALYSLLTTGSPNPVSALVGTRVYPLVLPQNVIMPAIRYQRISTPRSQYRTLDGKANYAAPRLQVDCYAATAAAAKQLADAVYGLLEGYNGTVGDLRIDAIGTDDERSELESAVMPGGSNLPRYSMDLLFYHAE